MTDHELTYMQRFIVPVGGCIVWTDVAPPLGFLECNGGAVSRTTYRTLFSIIGTSYGPGDGSTTFNVPDLGLA